MTSFMDEGSFLHSGAVIMVEGCKKYGWTWKIRDGNTRGAKSWHDGLDSWYRDKICGTTGLELISAAGPEFCRSFRSRSHTGCEQWDERST